MTQPDYAIIYYDDDLSETESIEEEESGKMPVLLPLCWSVTVSETTSFHNRY